MAKRKIYFVSKLAPNFRAGDVGTPEQRESEAHAIVQCVCTARKRLQLILAQAILVRNSHVEFGPKR